MPKHLVRIRSALDTLSAEVDFDAPVVPEGSGLSQGLESSHLSQPATEEELTSEEPSNLFTNQAITPDTSTTKRETSKRPRKDAKRKDRNN